MIIVTSIIIITLLKLLLIWAREIFCGLKSKEVVVLEEEAVAFGLGLDSVEVNFGNLFRLEVEIEEEEVISTDAVTASWWELVVTGAGFTLTAGTGLGARLKPVPRASMNSDDSWTVSLNLKLTQNTNKYIKV